MKLQDAVKKETAFMAAGCAVCSMIAIAAFAVLHIFFPEKVPFDYRVIVGVLAGAAVATGNFLWMAITVQKVSAAEDDDGARSIMKASYRFRTLAQLVWAVLAIVIPFINTAAGIIPLFFPGLVLKLRAVFSMRRGE